jgi:hypothetical protein
VGAGSNAGPHFYLGQGEPDRRSPGAALRPVISSKPWAITNRVMRTCQSLFVPIALATASCSQASAVTPDPRNDVDCSVLAFYFNGLGQHRGAPASVQRSLAKVDGWYVQKVQVLTQGRGIDPVRSRVEPRLEAVKKDPMNMRDAHMACAKRAIAEGLR